MHGFGHSDSWVRDESSVKLREQMALGDLMPNRTYRLSLREIGSRWHLVGQLGAYFDDELAYDAGAHQLKAGPVAATIPHHPVELTLRFEADDTTLREVVAATAEGETGTPIPAPEPQP